MPGKHDSNLRNPSKACESNVIDGLLQECRKLCANKDVMYKHSRCICICIYVYCGAFICPNTVTDSAFRHLKAKNNGNRKVFAVQVAKSSTSYRILTMFLCSAKQKPLQIAKFLSWPWPKTPLFTMFWNTLSKTFYLRRFRYLRGFLTFLRKAVKPR